MSIEKTNPTYTVEDWRYHPSFSFLVVLNPLGLVERYFQDVTDAHITDDHFEEMVLDQSKLLLYAPFLSDEDSGLIASALNTHKETRMPPNMLRASVEEFRRQRPFDKFLSFLQVHNMYDKYLENVIAHEITDDRFEEMIQFEATVKVYAPFLSSEESVTIVKALMEKKRRFLEKKCIDMLDMLDGLSLKEKYMSNILDHPASMQMYGRLLREPASVSEVLPFLDPEDVTKVQEGFEFKIKDNKYWQDFERSIPFDKFLNVLDHLNLREKYQKNVVESNIMKDEAFSSILESCNMMKDLKSQAPYITDLNERILIVDTLQRIKKSNGSNLLAYFPKDNPDGEALGEGSFGRVSWCYQADGNIVAEKRIFSKEANILAKVLEEFKILTKLDHPNIVKVWGYIQVDPKVVPVIIMDYHERGNLSTHLEKWYRSSLKNDATRGLETERRKARQTINLTKMSLDICNGMEYLHSQDCIHRDLKPENILIDGNNNAKIGDFGISRFFDEAETKQQNDDQKHYYSVYYTAKEAFPPNCEFSKSSDVWSYGVVLHQIWTQGKERPFGNDLTVAISDKTTLSEAKEAIRRGSNPLTNCPVSENCPLEIFAIMTDIFVNDPRPTFLQIKADLVTYQNIPLPNDDDFKVTSRVQHDRLLAALTSDRYTNDPSVLSLTRDQRAVHRRAALLVLRDNFVKYCKTELTNFQYNI